MIRLGLQLAVSGGREAITRLALIAVAVAVGVGLLLSTLAGLNAVYHQNDRYAWLETGTPGSNAPEVRPASSARLWWRLHADDYQGAVIGRVDVAAIGADAPVPPGLPRLPRAGEYYASPALARLLHGVPAAELADRYPGRLIGTIGTRGLPSAGALIVVVGRAAADLSREVDAVAVGGISTTAPSDCGACVVGVGTNRNGIVLILAVVTAALLFPVLIFIGGATRLSAARREQRFAALRLVGATPRQIAVLATVESVAATVVGVLVGYGVFWILRPAVAAIPFTGARFFVSDLTLTPLDVLAVAIGLPLAAAIVARLALRRIIISPLGVTRRVTPTPPSPWRLIPLTAGLAELAYFAYVHDIGATTGTNPTVEAAVFLIGVLVVMTGLVIAGPWLTMVVARVLGDHARRPAALMAARRLSDNPRSGFRAISGVVLAVFVGTCAIAIITTIAAGSVRSSGLGGAADRTLISQIDQPGLSAPVRAGTQVVTDELRAITGVTGAAVIRDFVAPSAPGAPGSAAPPVMVVSCAELATMPSLGRCVAGAATAVITTDYGFGGSDRPRPLASRTWPTASVTPAELARLTVDSIVVGTDGSSAAIERARTVLGRAYPRTFAPETAGEMLADRSTLLDNYRRLADVVILASLPIAGCSLAVSVVGGIIERRRPFSLLRLTGVPLGVLRRIVASESAAPLLITAAVSALAGFAAASLFLRAQLHESPHAPGLAYYVVLVAGLLASLSVIGTAVPVLERVTGPESARND